MSDWNHEKFLRLINVYEQKSELWDSSNKDYHLRNKKHDAWIQIALEMDCDVDLVPTSDIDIGGVSDSESEVDVLSGTDSINQEKADVEEFTSDDNINKQTPPRKLFLSPKKQPLRKRKQQEDLRISAANDIFQNVSSTPKNECFTFGQHIAIKIQKFEDRLRSIVMHKINNIIFDAEMGKYDDNNSSMQTVNQSRMPSVHAPSASPYTHELPSSLYLHALPS
ncbi:hypothetical protein RN001_013769 [Aquatica leii]|uniref:MADF domain-containing protein n=1 Tax=Aquatica leii TaxID=1421715 RepID=A0AAN7SE42_9COLE|nr:hypothetical protein RN001_013769 [Aquatica leii]